MKTHNADLKPPLIDLEAGSTATGGKPIRQPERLSEEGYTYTVYWIRLENHKNIFTEGYVGITKDLKMRMKAHKKSKKKTHLFYAKNKYGWNNLIKDIIYKNLSKEEALLLEAFYRNNVNIGWNSQRGGKLGIEKEWYLDENNKIKHSINTSKATKIGIALKDTTEKRSIRAKINRINNLESYKGLNVGDKNSRSILKEDQVRHIKYILIPEGKSNSQIAKLYGVKPYVIAFIRNNKNWKHV